MSIRQLGTESFVAHIVSSPYREKVIQVFKRYKTPLHMDLELPTLQAMKSFVATGNGVAFLPEISVKDELARGELVHIPVRELSLHRKLRLILPQVREPVARGAGISQGGASGRGSSARATIASNASPKRRRGGGSNLAAR